MIDHKRIAQQALITAEKIRNKLKIDRLTIIDPEEIAHFLGCEVRYEDLDSLEGIYSKDPKPVIIIGSHRPIGRKKFTCAHELGHHIFKHGTQLDEIDKTGKQNAQLEEEFLVDCFAGFLLMPKITVCNAMAIRNIDPSVISPIQIYTLSSLFGVGYSTILSHMTFSLKILSIKQYENLKKTTPKDIKKQFNLNANTELFIVDSLWKGRSVDLQLGDIIITPNDIKVEGENLIEDPSATAEYSFFEAKKVGYSRLLNNEGWGTHVRISRRDYRGLSKFRFLDDEE